jgi:CBS domain-containing membrane protein
MHSTDPVNRFMSTAVHTASPNESVKVLLQLFAEGQIHHVPVVEGSKVIGMVGAPDVLKLEFLLPPPGVRRDAMLDETWVARRIMRSPVITIPEHTCVLHAAEIMQKHGVHSLPVVNSNDELIGIVTTTDIIRECLNCDAHSSLSARRDAQFTLHTQSRLRVLANVAHVAKRYLNGGQDERLHAELKRALDCADDFDDEELRRDVLGLAQS